MNQSGCSTNSQVVWPKLVDHYNLSLYPGTLHQPPDPVNPTLLPTISQVEMDLAIAINATGLQPELFDLSSQSEICLKPW